MKRQLIEENYKIRLGLCCINDGLRKEKPPVFCSRTLIRKTFTVEKAQNLARQNARDLLTLLQWNQSQNPPLQVFRISSDLFPRITDTLVEPGLQVDCAAKELKAAGDFCLQHGLRVVMHPGQFCQVGAQNPKVLASTIRELEHHCDVLDAMGVPSFTGILIVHGGGTYGNKKATMERFVQQAFTLPKRVQQRLVLENDEKGYSIHDILWLAEQTRMPVVYDCFHQACYEKLHVNEPVADPKEFIPRVLATWPLERHPVIMHVSEQRADGRVGAHSDFIESIPDHVLTIPQLYQCHVDLEVEAKAKEAAIFQLRIKYQHLSFVQ